LNTISNLMNKDKNRQILSGGQAVVKTLKIKAVKHVFGLIGSATMELFDAFMIRKILNLLM